MPIASIKTAAHYIWGGNCDGWHLAASSNLSVIQERVPSGSAETRHLHHRAEQFFYILKGVATLEVDGVAHRLQPGEGMHVPAGAPHSLRNEHKQMLEFLVIQLRRAMGIERVHNPFARLCFR
ncbi:MAG TPA: cupin domain-containing protein [Cellvibrio sp.]|nr:cupin domain-containing protein [Cellvibrio sp.]